MITFVLPHYTHIQALEEQYQDEGGHKITNYNEFMFNKDDKTDPHLKIVPSEPSQFVIALEPSSAKVSINFTNLPLSH